MGLTRRRARDHQHPLARTQTGSLEGLVAQYSAATGHDTIASTIDSLGETVGTLTRSLVERVSQQAKSLEQAHQWTNDIVRLGESIGTIAASALLLTITLICSSVITESRVIPPSTEALIGEV